MPGKPVLIVEDDIQVASLFSLRLSSLITAVEVRAQHPARALLTAVSLACMPQDAGSAIRLVCFSVH